MKDRVAFNRAELLRDERMRVERADVLEILSGGGSALLPLPAPRIGLEEIARATDLLLKAGTTIDQLNTGGARSGQALRRDRQGDS